MSYRWEWGCGVGQDPPSEEQSDWASVLMPVAEWFDIEMEFQAGYGDATVRLWINGTLALEQTGMRTAHETGHAQGEMYIKMYGRGKDGVWVPNTLVKYFRNVRMSTERIWRP